MDKIWIPDITGSHLPAYKAIAESITQGIKSGILQPGHQLPTHRALAELLGLSIGTITRGYAEAERLQLIQSTVGSGTFVLSKGQKSGDLGIDAPSADILDMSLSVALPLEARYITKPYFDLAADLNALARMSRYQPEISHEHLRAAHEKWLAAIGVNLCETQHICTTVGGQHALYAALSSVCEAGDTILSDQLTYPGLLAIGRRLNIKVVGIESDQFGMVPDALALAIQRYMPKAVYLMTRLSTPTCMSMPQSRIDTIAKIVQEKSVWMIEDDVQGCLHPTSNALFINTVPHSTLLVSSLSKALLGGLRIGLLYVPERLSRSVRNTVTTQILVPPMLTSELYTQLMLDNDLHALMAKQKQKLAERHRIAHTILGDYLSEHTAGSLNIWLTLPAHWRPESFVKAMKEEGVIIKSAASFCTSRTYVPAAVRISLGGTLSDTQLIQGLTKIKAILNTEAHESFV
ncbi:PLP-dependent aminotransferase family protein [Vibrio gazogenes]|uniref:HTH gntR-type domain-containing protein n=1 Tax=Vibrio gazogenes TaxID=687 RepID=A0A1Z2SH20_VIBGA|nr:PLP-dependent aminotransferase family protein [Vibrio gazogenes]ASA56483.1 hypothetical protein BSQ33_12770 [Vibrio gazogenes]